MKTALQELIIFWLIISFIIIKIADKQYEKQYIKERQSTYLIKQLKSCGASNFKNYNYDTKR